MPVPIPRLHSLGLTLLALSITGCGGTITAPIFRDLTGNWQFNVEIPPTTPPTIPTNVVGHVFGALRSTGDKVTGTVNVQPYGFISCVPTNADLQATGAVDDLGILTLTAPIATGALTLTLDVSPTNNRFLNGSLQITGGPCTQSTVALDGYRVPILTGTFAGTLSPTAIFGGPATPSTVTATLTQSPAPNADGQYALTGTVTATAACTATFNFTAGLVYGDGFASQTPIVAFTTPPPIYFTGAINPGDGIQANSILAGLNFAAGSPCTTALYSGALTRQ